MDYIQIKLCLLFGIIYHSAAESFLKEPPSYVLPCKIYEPGFTKCSTSSIQALFTQLSKGIPGLKSVGPIDPFFLKKVVYKQDNNQVATISANLTDLIVKGFGKTIIKESKVSKKDFSWETKLFIPKLRIDGNYKMEGKVLVLPLRGNGKMFIEAGADSHGFGYSQPNQRRWGRQHGHCSGKIQSPISVQNSKAIHLHMPAIDLIGYHNLLPHPLKLMNNGHTVSITIPKFSQEAIKEGDFLPYIKGGKLPGEFEVESVHFHWGDKNNRGAEHVINDIRYTMEMHIVHRNKKYENLSVALEHSDGAAVLGFFFALEDSENDGLVAITRHLSLIANSNDFLYMNVTFALSSFLSKIDLDKFYTYRGSLTTPPCSEAITWVLYPNTLPVSPKQMSRFRQLQDTIDGALVDNFRTLQPIGNRRVFVRAVNTHHTTLMKLQNEISHTKWDWFY